MWSRFLVAAVLFYAFIPGVLVTLPPKGSLMTVRVVHALLFAVVLYCAMKYVRQYEHYGNHGPSGCPRTHYESHLHGTVVCLPKAGTRTNPPGFEVEGKR